MPNPKGYLFHFLPKHLQPQFHRLPRGPTAGYYALPKNVRRGSKSWPFQSSSVEEIHGVLLSFHGDKSPGLDAGLLSYSHTFELFQYDLVNLVEESRLLGFVHPLLNSTYIALIPKKPNTQTFFNFRPISLYNLVYKIISKSIANHLKPILSSFISPQQFSFLKHCQIHDAVAATHVCLLLACLGLT